MKRIARLLALLVGVLLLLILTLPFLVDANRFRPMLESELAAALGRPVKIGDLKLALVSGGVTASDLSIVDDPAFSREAFLRAKSLHIGVEMLPLIFSHKLNVVALTVERPEIALVQNTAGGWNFSTLGAQSPPKPAAGGAANPGSGSSLALSVKEVKISDGRLTLGPRVLESLTIDVQDFSPTSVFSFAISAKPAGGGEIKLEGKAGPIASVDATRTPFHASLGVKRFDLASPGIGGVVTVAGDAGSDGDAVDFTGQITIEKLKLAPQGSAAERAVRLDSAVRHELRRRRGALIRGDIHIGKAAASLIGTYDLQGPTAAVNMKLTGNKMPLPELVAMFPAFHITLPAGSSIQGGAASLHMTAEGALDRITSNGSLSIENARLAGFDLGAKMSVVERLAGIKTGPNTEIEVLSANIKSAPSGTNIDQLKLVAPAIGELTGGGAISPQQALDFRMHATLYAGGVVMTALGAKGEAGVPFSIQGTASNPVFKPDVKAMVSNRLKSAGATRAKGLIQGLLGKH